MPFHMRSQRWAALICHRRAGKTVATINDTVQRALYTQRPRARYAYIAPFYAQAKQIAWDYLKYYTAQIRTKASESALSVDLFNDSRITLYGADNPDSLRGIYLDGVDIDEYGQCRPNLWTEIIRPTLADRQGWATFIGTPNGPNHFYDLWELALNDPNWFTMVLRASESNIIPAEELEEMKRLMSEDEYEAEMECSWFASVRGSYYGKELQQANITEEELPVVSHVPCHYVFDLGFTDSTACWRWQEFPDHILLSLAREWNSEAIQFYIDWLHGQRDSGVTIGNVWLPHDARAKSLQTGRSIVEQFLANGITPRLVPNLGINDGIAAARMLFPTLIFSGPACHQGLNALKTYHREFNEETKAFRNRPFHDSSSHFADAFRYLALVARLLPKENIPVDPGPIATTLNYGFHLEQLHEDRSRLRRRL